MAEPQDPHPADVEFSKKAAEKAELADEMERRGVDLEAVEAEEEDKMERGEAPVPSKADQTHLADGTPDR